MHQHILSLGYDVNIKRIRRLLRLMGLLAIYPKRNLSNPNIEHKKFPYLLRNLKIYKCNQVWSSDITYIPMEKGFLYLVAIIDWYSRYVLSWRLSNSMDGSFCREALTEALERSRACPRALAPYCTRPTPVAYWGPATSWVIPRTLTGTPRRIDVAT